jgi:hypothetical protein
MHNQNLLANQAHQQGLIELGHRGLVTLLQPGNSTRDRDELTKLALLKSEDTHVTEKNDDDKFVCDWTRIDYGNDLRGTPSWPCYVRLRCSAVSFSLEEIGCWRLSGESPVLRCAFLKTEKNARFSLFSEKCI